jgi:hypothetical protein
MGMPAQDQADVAVVDDLDEIGIVRQKENGIILGGVPQRDLEILMVDPEVANAADPQSGTASLDPDALIVEIGKLCRG